MIVEAKVVKRTERIWLKPNDKIGRLCHLSKNLYNEANYIIRQELFLSGKWLRYNKLAGILKTSENYKELPAQTAQQTLKILDRNWKAFFRAMKEWKAHPEKFKEQPRMPHYKRKDGEFVLVFTNQQAKLRNGWLILPKMVGLEVKTRLGRIDKGKGGKGKKISLREVRIIPRGVGYLLEIVYEKKINLPKRNKDRIAGIDIGVRNLITMVNNIGEQPIVVKGGVIRKKQEYRACMISKG